MNEQGKIVKLRYYRSARTLDEALPFLRQHLRNAGSGIAECDRFALAGLIIESCRKRPTLKKVLDLSDEELADIADGPIPKHLVEQFVAYLESEREEVDSCICG